MIRVVVDANVLVSAAISVGPSHRIVSASFMAEGVTAVVCPALLAEVSSVLDRPRIQKRLPARRAAAFLDDLVTLLHVVADPSKVLPVTRDPKDDYLVALAVEHGVDFIVSGDKDLLDWEEQSPPVMARRRSGTSWSPTIAERQGCRVANGLLMASSALERYRAVGSGFGGRQMPL